MFDANLTYLFHEIQGLAERKDIRLLRLITFQPRRLSALDTAIAFLPRAPLLSCHSWQCEGSVHTKRMPSAAYIYNKV